MRPVELIGVASGWGAPDHGCEDGPVMMRDAGQLAPLEAADRGDLSFTLLYPAQQCEDVTRIAALCERLAAVVYARLAAGRFPVVVGGDHSCAVGTWNGVRRAVAERGPLGLIWVDAHMDSHVPATSPSGALHGMPLACLLGHGEPSLLRIGGPGAKVQPEHLCLLGVRSFEADEADLLARLGVRVIFMEEIHARGLRWAWDEAQKIATAGTAGYGISIDLDAVEPEDAPGVGTPAPGGIAGTALLEVLREVAADPRLLALEIAEYNPHHDRDGRTLRLLNELILAATGDKDAPADRIGKPLLRA